MHFSNLNSEGRNTILFSTCLSLSRWKEPGESLDSNVLFDGDPLDFSTLTCPRADSRRVDLYDDPVGGQPRRFAIKTV